MLKPEDFFELQDSPFASLFNDCQYVWDALKKLPEYIKTTVKGNVADIRQGQTFITKTVVLYEGRVLEGGFAIDTAGKKPQVLIDGAVLAGASIIYAGSVLMDDLIYIGQGTVVESGAYISGPAYIGNNTEVRQGAYIRGQVLVGDNCVVGHTTEIKSSVMLGGSKAGHFAYIGDSILGKVNLGAGTKIANLKITGSAVKVSAAGVSHETGLRKFGAILGDGVETGCNSVTTPGTLLSKNVLLYPNSTARGYYPPQKIVKSKIVQEILDFGFA
ncbi:LbetaH domain-containing protein [Dethiobacter alkaliphilus]|uniref:glucose-1-phosphate thymidylyltransferase n=1 Tax=Dethiobacter alkaliphilus TaxID=427926 RepID=UPI0022266DFF|nr:glucose-1-phosphate thymidylyltransferase [Dethiobacter alkaliphilus]MCW3490618.1 glucose-1-phosphate thymidylyltransferase [Dethiobacter alkaliphilus]